MSHRSYPGFIGQRRGQAEHLFQNILRIGLMVVSILTVYLLVNFYIDNSIDNQELIAKTVTSRIIYSDAITYKDPYTQRLLPGVIDISKLNDANVKNSIDFSEYKKYAAAKIKIESKQMGGVRPFLQEAYVNKEQWDTWYPIVRTSATGKGSVMIYISEYPITYIRGMQKDFGIMTVEVIVPNE